MNPRFEVNDKVLDPATGKTGYVSSVKFKMRSSGSVVSSGTYEYDIAWLAPKLSWGSYESNVADAFQRVDTSWNRLMAPPSEDYGDGET